MAGFITSIRDFAEGVQVEMRRVVWPDREQLRQTTIVVLVFTILLALVIGAMDSLFSFLVRMIVGGFRG